MTRLKPTSFPVIEGRSAFQVNVLPSKKVKQIFSPAGNNNKLGKGKTIIKKGPFKGLPLYTLYLEERKTCPRNTCHHWVDCYGNNSPYVKRVVCDNNFYTRAGEELEKLCNEKRMSGGNGVVLRLHGLGDFHSVKYVNFWAGQLKKYKNLIIYGFTARWNDKIYKAIRALAKKYPDRFIIRFSRNRTLKKNSKIYYAANKRFKGKGVKCPEQDEKTESCLTCGLCFNPNFHKTIIFKDH